jgi:hypothetical protein
MTHLVPRALLAVAALAAAASAVAAVPAAVDAAPDGALTEWWRAYGLAVFAGLFALLAREPGRHLGVWLLSIAHKAAMTATALALPAATDAGTVALADGVLTVLLLAAFALAEPWQHTRSTTAPAP